MNFINFSNHPTNKWDEKQLGKAKEFGEIVDVPFPNIPPEFSHEDVRELISNALGAGLFYYNSEGECNVQRKNVTLHVMGEMAGFFEAVIFAFTSRVFDRVVVSTTNRRVVEKDGVKVSIFEFVKFREIKNPLPEIIENAFKEARSSGATVEVF